MKLPPIPGLVLIIVLWAVFYAAQGVYAAEQAQPDMRVLIDISGSMKKTDPENLRVPAVKLLLNLAKENSQFGVWSFGQFVNNLVPSASVNSDWKKQVVTRVDGINSAGLFTNIGLALEKASKGQTTPDPLYDRTMVLLSDGMVDISKDPAINATEKQRILEEVVPALKKAGFKIHSVALSEEADQAFLKQIALATGGSYSLARNADELLEVFVDASDKVNAPEQVPLENNTFSIDESIKEFTALIFRKPGTTATTLIAPDGAKYSQSQGSRNLSWFSDKQYDLITFYNPAPGTWKVMADLDPENRVTVISDLNVTIAGLPENVLEGERLTMTMQMDERGRTITNPNFLELMDITFRQETAQGERFEGKLSHRSDGSPKVPEDGVYSAKLGRTITEGEHTFSIIVDGKSFKRKKSVSVMVHRNVLDVETHYRDHEGEVLQSLVASPVLGLTQQEELTIMAQISDPKGEKTIQNGVQLEDGSWQVDVLPFGAQGEYEVRIKVSGTSVNGKPFELVQGPYIVDYSPLGINTSPEMIEPDPIEEEPPVPVETFDASAMEIPDLEVDELPPDDMPPAEEDVALVPDVIDDPDLGGDLVSEAEQPEEETNWILLASVFVLGNILIIGGGIFLYIKFLRKSEAEQTKVLEEINEIQQQKQDKGAKPEVPDLEQEVAAELAGESELELGEESTQIISDAVADPGEQSAEASAEAEAFDDASDSAVAPVEPETPAQPEEAEESYINEAEPLELDDDEMIEVDDFDDELDDDVDESLEGLDEMLSEQEAAMEASEEELSQTIDEMLEAPTVFPENESDEDTGFDDDEFMLDDPKKE